MSLIDTLNSLLKDDEISPKRFILHYGSKKETSDIDLFIITDDLRPYSIFSYGRLDISIINFRELLFQINHFDLLSTEPLLTGNLLFGNTSEFNEFRNINLYQMFDEKVQNHLNERISNLRKNTIGFWQSYCSKINNYDLFWTLMNLSYILTYSCILNHYKIDVKNKILTVNELKSIYKERYPFEMTKKLIDLVKGNSICSDNIYKVEYLISKFTQSPAHNKGYT